MVAEVEYLQHPYNIKQIYAKRRGTLKHVFANGKKGIKNDKRNREVHTRFLLSTV